MVKCFVLYVVKMVWFPELDLTHGRYHRIVCSDLCFLCLFFINSMLLLRCKIIINLIPTKVCTYYLLSYWIWNHWFIQLIPSNDQHIKVNLQSKYRLNFEDFNNLYERLLSLMANNLILMYDNTKVAPKLQHRIKII